jgi:Variant SH3 domain
MQKGDVFSVFEKGNDGWWKTVKTAYPEDEPTGLIPSNLLKGLVLETAPFHDQHGLLLTISGFFSSGKPF